MNRLAFVALLFLLFSSQKVSGQIDSTSTMVFTGKIFDDSLKYALPGVHLWNESTRMGTISNDSGEFRIHAKIQDTLVFSAIGYFSHVLVVHSSSDQIRIGLKQRNYEIDELVVRRFRNYESFKYAVIHRKPPESEIAETKEHMNVTSTKVAVKADWERNAKEKLEKGFGFSTTMGPGFDRQKANREKILALKERKRVISAKYNRELVGDITKLEGDELSEFIALCDYSEEYLFQTDLYTIIEDLHIKLNDYHKLKDTITSFNGI